MSDFLKKIKQSLENGEENSEVVNQHFDLLHGADMVDALRQAKKEEENTYDNELTEFVQGKGVDAMMENERIRNLIDDAAQDNEQGYIDEVFNYTGNETREEMMKKMQAANDHAKKQEALRKKKELIEMNSAHIKMLEDEIKIWEGKIAKHRDLIQHLKQQIEREQ